MIVLNLTSQVTENLAWQLNEMFSTESLLYMTSITEFNLKKLKEI